MGICYECAQAVEGDDVCPACGGVLVALSADTVNALVARAAKEAMREQIETWERGGVVDGKTRIKMLSTLVSNAAVPARSIARAEEEARARENEHARQQAHAREEAVRQDKRRREAEAAREQARRADEKRRKRRQEEETRRTRARRRRDDDHEVATPGAGAIDGTADVFVALDTERRRTQPRGAPVWPLVYENIGWLIGAVFVLAGSIYGVREAWVTLSPVGRYATVAAAFFAYHAGFLGLAVLLAGKAPRAARFIGGVAVTLVPVVGAAIANLAAADATAGILAAALFSGLTAATTWRIGKLFAAAPLFVLASLPSALLGLLLPSLGSTASVRFILPIVGLIPTLTLTLRARTFEPIAFALFGALALELFALTSASPDTPNDSVVWRTGSGVFFAWLCVWVAALSTLLCLTAMRSRNSWPRASLAAAAFGGALAVSAALGATLDVTSNDTTAQQLLLALVTCVTAALAAGLGMERFFGLRHAVTPLAALSAMLLGRLLAPELRWDAAALLTSFAFFARVPADDRSVRRSQNIVLCLTLVLMVFVPTPPTGLSPTDHVLLWSIALAALGVDTAAILALAVGTLSVWSIDFNVRAPATVWLSCALALLASALITHRTRLMLVWAATLCAWGAMGLWTFAGQTQGHVALYAAALALLFTTCAALLPRLVVFAAGFAMAALASGLLTTLLDIAWLMTQTADERVLHIEAMALVAMALFLAFVSKSHVRFDMRGRVAVLAGIGVLIALAAVTNRIGRPLPPRVVAQNLSIGIVALWLVAQAARRWGPALGKRLEAEEDGPRYHWVIHGGVMALSALLLVDVLLLSPASVLRVIRAVPSFMLLGPAIGCLLLARSLRWQAALAAAVPLAACGAALALGGGMPGPVLEPLQPPGGQWVPDWAVDNARLQSWLADSVYLFPGEPARPVVARALVGAAGVTALAALIHAVVRTRGLALGAVITIVGLIAFAFTASGELASLIVLAASLLLAAATPSFRVLVPLAAGLCVHAFAQGQPVFPLWASIALALMGTAVAIIAVLRSNNRQMDLFVASGVAITLWLFAWCYALAQNGAPLPLAEAQGVTVAMLGLSSAPQYQLASALTFLLAGIGLHVLAAAFGRHHLSGLIVPAAHHIAAAVALGTAAAYAARFADYQPGPLTALAFALLAAGHHLVAMPLAASANRLGLRGGRELLLLSVGLALLGAALGPPAGDATPALWLGLAALAAVTSVCALAAWQQRTQWHVYLLYTAISGGYGWVRWALADTLQPRTDAMAALAFAFVLVGVVVALHRVGAEQAAVASRRFAALLPIAAALLLPWQASTEAALLSACAAALYALLGWAANSRLIGAFGAVGANVALLLLTLAQGISGVEVYLVPLGLLLAMLVHLFADDTDMQVRFGLRFAASLLVFAPAAIKIVLQIDNAQDDVYAFSFAGACLLATGIGMLLHIRAYLAAGVFFLLLDITASVARASLRDQRLGFFVLSATGLIILGGMVLLTTQREVIMRTLARVRTRIADWD